jgi:signal transduction histidine kinase/ActR/RegA family two-component response regulator
MKIVTSMHLALATAASTAVALALAGLSFHNTQRNSTQQRQTLDRIVQGVGELHIRTDEYMDRSRFDIRPLHQWQVRDRAVAADLKKIRGETGNDMPDATRLIQSLTARHQELEQLFAKLIRLRAAADNDSLAYIQQERLLGGLYVLLEEQFAEADELRHLTDIAESEALAHAVLLGAVTLVLMMGSVLLCAGIVRSNFSTPLQRLLAATEAIGSGHLDHRIGSKADDEIGALSRAFDTMAERLQHVTASRNDLAHTKAALHRLNATLEERVATRTAALERMHEQLHHAQKMEAVGQLTGGIAHDFNNLLASIVGNVEMMQVRLQQKRYDDLPRYVAAIMAVTDRATALTHRLLAFSRRQALDPRPVDAKTLVASMRELIQRAVGPAIRLETELPDSACVTLCDTNQFESAVLNLAINARDAMPQGGQLTIEVTQACVAPAHMPQAARDAAVPAPGDYVVVSVSDSGIGMTPDTVARAFDPFFTTKPLGQGTGLGLSMVYGFIKQSGGNVTIESQPGHGTTVRLYLPHYRGTLEPARQDSKPATLPRADRAATVLVLDDEPEVRATTVEMLQELGYTAIPTENCDDCLRMLQSAQPIDLLITDVGLPGDMDGWRLADKAREIRQDLKVLFITGYTQNPALSGPPRPQAGEILTKPFAMDAFALKVRNVMSSAQPAHCTQ